MQDLTPVFSCNDSASQNFLFIELAQGVAKSSWVSQWNVMMLRKHSYGAETKTKNVANEQMKATIIVLNMLL